MLNIILGFLAIILGLWGVFCNWWILLDFLKVIIPLVLVFYGTIAILAGVGKFKVAPPQTPEA